MVSMMTTKVYVVKGASGYYEDWQTWDVKAFRNLQSAEAFVKKLSAEQKKADKVNQEYRNLTGDYDKYFTPEERAEYSDPNLFKDYWGAGENNPMKDDHVDYRVEAVDLEEE